MQPLKEDNLRKKLVKILFFVRNNKYRNWEVYYETSRSFLNVFVKSRPRRPEPRYTFMFEFSGKTAMI